MPSCAASKLRLPFLATLGSAAPFIGLFGTVWGSPSLGFIVLLTNSIWRNAEQEKLLGMDGKAYRDKHPFMKSRIHPDDYERISVGFQKSLDQKIPFHNEWRVIHDDGSVHWIHSRGRPLFDKKGWPLRMIGINFDIDERKKILGLLSFRAEASKILARSLRLRNNFRRDRPPRGARYR